MAKKTKRCLTTTQSLDLGSIRTFNNYYWSIKALLNKVLYDNHLSVSAWSIRWAVI